MYGEQWRKARQEHQCCECNSTIDIGETYKVYIGLWNGKWFRCKQCEFCARVWEKKINDYPGCLALGEMWDFLGGEV